MEKYLNDGKWVAWPVAIIAWVASLLEVIDQLGLFIGIPLGFFIGMIYASIAYGIASLLWPLAYFIIAIALYKILGGG